MPPSPRPRSCASLLLFVASHRPLRCLPLVTLETAILVQRGAYGCSTAPGWPSGTTASKRSTTTTRPLMRLRGSRPPLHRRRRPYPPLTPPRCPPARIRLRPARRLRSYGRTRPVRREMRPPLVVLNRGRCLPRPLATARHARVVHPPRRWRPRRQPEMPIPKREAGQRQLPLPLPPPPSPHPW